MGFKQDVKEITYGSGIMAIIFVIALIFATGAVSYYYFWAPTIENKNYEIVTNTNSFIQTQLTALNNFYFQVTKLKTQISLTDKPEQIKAYNAQIKAIIVQMNQTYMQLPPKQRGYVPSYIVALLGQ